MKTREERIAILPSHPMKKRRQTLRKKCKSVSKMVLSFSTKNFSNDYQILRILLLRRKKEHALLQVEFQPDYIRHKLEK